jgi:hypothetical protein
LAAGSIPAISKDKIAGFGLSILFFPIIMGMVTSAVVVLLPPYSILHTVPVRVGIPLFDRAAYFDFLMTPFSQQRGFGAVGSAYA